MASAANIPVWVPAIMVSAVALSSLALVLLAHHEHQRKLTGDDREAAPLSPDYITAAVPFFFVLMALEWILIRAIRFQSVAAQYDLGDSLCSVSSGITQQLTARLGVAAVQPFVLFPYEYIWQRWALARPPADHVALWIGGFLFVDLCYYWLHRLAHQVAVLWAGHSVHHNSDGYRLTTALRQSSWQSCFGWLFYLPLALFMPPPVFYGINQLNTWYQFWVHTCLVRRLPAFLEWFLVTPSHHRVHHDRRVHKNFAGSCIIWDRMFGTFLDETEMPPAPRGASTTDDGDKPDNELELRNRKLGCTVDGEELCLFGTYRAPESWTEAVTQTEVWGDVLRRRGAGLRRFLVGPGFTTVTARRWLVAPGPGSVRLRLRSQARSGLAVAYVLVHWALLLGLATSLLVLKLGLAELVVACGASLAGLFCVLGLVDGRPEDRRREAVRCGLGLAACVAGSLVASHPELAPYWAEGSVFLLQAPAWLWMAVSSVFAGSLLLLAVAPERLVFDTWSSASETAAAIAAKAKDGKAE